MIYISQLEILKLLSISKASFRNLRYDNVIPDPTSTKLSNNNRKMDAWDRNVIINCIKEVDERKYKTKKNTENLNKERLKNASKAGKKAAQMLTAKREKEQRMVELSNNVLRMAAKGSR